MLVKLVTWLSCLCDKNVTCLYQERRNSANPLEQRKSCYFSNAYRCVLQRISGLLDAGHATSIKLAKKKRRSLLALAHQYSSANFQTSWTFIGWQFCLVYSNVLFITKGNLHMQISSERKFEQIDGETTKTKNSAKREKEKRESLGPKRVSALGKHLHDKFGADRHFEAAIQSNVVTLMEEKKSNEKTSLQTRSERRVRDLTFKSRFYSRLYASLGRCLRVWTTSKCPNLFIINKKHCLRQIILLKEKQHYFIQSPLKVVKSCIEKNIPFKIFSNMKSSRVHTKEHFLIKQFHFMIKIYIKQKTKK